MTPDQKRWIETVKSADIALGRLWTKIIQSDGTDRAQIYVDTQRLGAIIDLLARDIAQTATRAAAVSQTAVRPDGRI